MSELALGLIVFVIPLAMVLFGGWLILTGTVALVAGVPAGWALLSVVFTIVVGFGLLCIGGVLLLGIIIALTN